MGECVVVGCRNEGADTISKTTPGGDWNYWVCEAHAAEARAGASISDNPDGRSIVLESAVTASPEGAAGDPGSPTLSADPDIRSGQLGTDTEPRLPGDRPDPKELNEVESR